MKKYRNIAVEYKGEDPEEYDRFIGHKKEAMKSSEDGIDEIDNSDV